MLSEAVDIIGALFDSGERVNYRGRHFDVEQAQLWDRPSERVPIGIAVSGPSSCELAGHKADIMIAVEPKAELGEMFDAAGGSGKPRVGQIALGCGPDVEEHVEKIRPFVEAGFTEVALVQIGAEHQEPFVRWAEQELLPALRSL